MTQEKQERKNPGRAIKIFKCIGLGILTLLILLALIIEAPKKLVILLVIILAAFTALPKPYRKYFWLGAAGILIALIIWILLPINNEGWQRYEFNLDEKYKELEAKYSIPPEENAAVLYIQLMESYDDDDYHIFHIIDHDPNIFDDTFRNPWLSKDYPEITDWFKNNQSIIETLIDISKIEKCMFPVSDPIKSESLYNINSAIRCWARMLVIAINNDIAEGRNEKAAEKIAIILQMAKHLYQQPWTINFLTGLSAEQLAIRPLNRIVIENEALDSHIEAIEKALPDIKNNWNSILNRTIEFDKLWSRTDLSAYYEVNSKGRIRFTQDPWAQLRASGRELHEDKVIDIKEVNPSIADFIYPSYIQQKLTKAETILRWLTMPSDPEKAAETLGECLDRYDDIMTEPDFDWEEKTQQSDSFITSCYYNILLLNHTNFAQVLAYHWAKSHYSTRDLYLRKLTLRRGTRTLLAIKKYKNENGSWPESLEEIKTLAPAEAFIDPVTGNPLEYENHGQDFSLYGETINIWPG